MDSGKDGSLALKGKTGEHLVPQTCFSMRVSDCAMVENQFNSIKVAAFLRAQFFPYLFPTRLACGFLTVQKGYRSG